MGMNLDDSTVIELIGKVVVVTALMILLVVIFLFFLHICNKVSRTRNHVNRNSAVARFQFVEDFTPLRRGLDPSVLKLIPVVFVEDMKEKLECAVCLCEVSQGEKARLLPKCNHGFHVECVDMWFQSNSTCPICRNQVSDMYNFSSAGFESTSIDLESTSNENSREESSNLLPTNSLFSGNETHLQVTQPPVSSTSSSSSTSTTTSNGDGGMLVIDISQQINEEIEEEATPPAPPKRLSSFKRLLSREKRVSPCCSSHFDDQQQTRS